jgi:hypothetical protein
MELEFAPIDAKDFDGTYDVIKISNYSGTPRTEHNVIVVSKAIKEYLKRLQALQKEIAKKYEPSLKDDSEIDSEDSFCQDNCGNCPEKYCHIDGDEDRLFYN